MFASSAVSICTSTSDTWPVIKLAVAKPSIVYLIFKVQIPGPLKPKRSYNVLFYQDAWVPEKTLC
jgi:hypothetical protein